MTCFNTDCHKAGHCVAEPGTGCRACPPAAAPAAPPMDAGPWSVMEHDRQVFVSSDDFTHDVCLRVNGDFESPDQRRAYAAQLCAKLNAPAAPDALSRSHELLRQAHDALEWCAVFIRNGVALGYIRMPDADCPDSAHETPRVIDAAIAAITAYLPKEPT